MIYSLSYISPVLLNKGKTFKNPIADIGLAAQSQI